MTRAFDIPARIPAHTPFAARLARAALLCACAWACIVMPAHAAETTTYVFVNDNIGEPGRQVVERGDDGLTTVTYIYKNNGRGPELTERFRLAADGTFSEYHVTGSSELGAVVDDHFERRGAAATWQSTSERGSAMVSGPALYLPLNSSNAPVSVAIAAIAARPDGQIPLLPSGTLRHRRVDEVEVVADVAGTRRSQRVQLLVQTGIGLQPTFIWATTGAAPRLFALDDGAGETFIEAGWQGNRQLLSARQRAAEEAALRERATRLRHPLSGLTVIRNARVFDSETATLATNLSDVYVLRDRITAIRPAGSDPTAVDAEIDAAGRVMLPGLFDMHAHAWRWEGALDLAAGVTTLRDMGNDNAAMQRMLDDTAAGRLLMPRIEPCGFIEGRSPFSSSNGITISTLAEAKAAVDWYASRGYRQIKIYNSFPPLLLKDTVAHAHSRGLRVSGHVPAFMRAQDVVEQGFDEIQHINQVLLNFLVTAQTDTRTLERFNLPAELAGAIDFDSKPVTDFLQLLKDHQTVIDPTLATFDFIRQKDGSMAAPYASVAAHLPPDVQRYFALGGMKIPDEATLRRNENSYAKMVAFVGRMYRAGIPIVAGTDALPGITLHSELALYVEAGLTPSEAIQVATRNAARYSGTASDRGRIAPGLRADLVLVDGEPTRDIGDLKRAALVITQGHWLSPKELHEDLGIAPFVQSVPEVRSVVQSVNEPAAAKAR